MITIPVHFHIFHQGATGREYTCTGDYNDGFTGPHAESSCKYITDQIEVLNKGFGGIAIDQAYPKAIHHKDTKFQFCLASSNKKFDASAYDDRKSFNDREGQMESLNVWANEDIADKTLPIKSLYCLNLFLCSLKPWAMKTWVKSAWLTTEPKSIVAYSLVRVP